MPDNTLKIGAEVNLLDLNSRMAEGSQAVRSAIDKMLVSFQEASTGSARAVSRITEDTRAAAVTVSSEWKRVADATLAYNAALKEVSAASYLARKAGQDDAVTTSLLAAAKQKAAIASTELAAAEKAVAVAEEEAGGAAIFFKEALNETFGPLLALEGLLPIIGFEVLRRGMDNASEFSLKMRNLSAITGIAAGELAGLHDVIGEMGGEWDSVAVSLARMAKSQQDAIDGQEKQITAFRRMGISVSDLKKLSPEELFFRLAEGFNRAGSTAEKNAVAVEIFGRGGRALIPVFQVGSERLRDFIEEAKKSSGVSDENMEASERWHAITEKLSVGLRALALESMPLIMKSGAVVVAAFEGLAAALVTVFDVIATTIATVLEGLFGIGKIIYDIITGNFQDIAKDSATAKSRISTDWTNAAKEIKGAWGTVSHDVKALWSGADVNIPRIKPPLGGEIDIPGAGTGETRLREWRLQLEEMQRAEDGFHELSKAEEVKFWQEKLALSRGNARLYSEVYHLLREAERAAQRESLRDWANTTRDLVAGEKQGSIERVIILQEELQFLKSIGAEQTEYARHLQTELTSATREYSEMQARAAVEADRRKVESTRRASDERIAAEFSVLEHLKALGLEGTAEYTAQLRRLTEAELAAHNEKLKLQELDIEQDRIRAQSSIEVRRQQVQTDFALHLISAQQRIALLKDLENQEYEINKAALAKKLALLEKDPTISPVVLRQIHNQIENLEREHKNRMGQIDTTATKERMNNLDQFFNKLTSGFQQAITGMLQGQRTFVQGLAQMWNGLLTDWINMLAKKLMAWAQHEIMILVMHNTTNKAQTASDAATAAAGEQISLVSAIKKIGRAAATAAAHAFKGVMETVPFPANVILAPLAAAGAFTAVMAFQSMASARSGMVSEDEQMAFIHKNEMVLPASLSMGFQRIISGMSGTGQMAVAGAGGHHVWTGDLHVNGAGDPEEVADRVFHQVTTFFRTGGVHRR